MQNPENKYEPVIGLEVHIQLLTKSKAFSSDSTAYGSSPNTNISAISLGHPGTLPKLNKKVVEYAVRLGLSCKSNINSENQFARKNYFYPDLPKGYQISQHTTPVCTGGFIKIKANNAFKKIGITRIHIEEDAGKNIHDRDPFSTFIDLNRAGVPLLEMVSEPDFRTPEEAYQYLTEVRKLVRYLGICDGNMEEGSLRCDANVSVRLKGAEKFGEKVEVKNMNSITNVKRALEYEIERQINAIEKGENIYQETMTFDAVSGKTLLMRRKEMADDYRYFPEPDLPKLIISDDYIEEVKKTLPPLPDDLFIKYTGELHLSDYDASVLTDTKEIALYFERLIKHTINYKAAANWIMGPVKTYLNENSVEIGGFPVEPKRIAQLIKMIEDGKVSNTVAAQKVFPKMISELFKPPLQIAEENGWMQDSNKDSLQEFVKRAINKYPEKVTEYKSGKKGVVGLFMGEVMKLSGGKADPRIANQMVIKALEE